MRQALAMAINKPAIIEACSTVPARRRKTSPLVWSADAELKDYDYDPQKASVAAGGGY